MPTVYIPTISTGDSDDVPAMLSHLAHLMRSDPLQKRKRLDPHDILMRVAQARADDLSARDYFSHVDPEGNGPNQHVRRAGYPLPDWYPQGRQDNSIESIGGGYSTADDFWGALKGSPGHRSHVLGLHAMYAGQVNIGVGWSYMQSSRYRPIWVIITCP